MKKIENIKIGKELFEIYKSDKPKKQLLSINKRTGNKVYFGDPNMKEYPGTPRGDNYCSRSLGIAKKYDIKGDVNSANFWSRWYLWNCKGKKSLNRRPKI